MVFKDSAVTFDTSMQASKPPAEPADVDAHLFMVGRHHHFYYTSFSDSQLDSSMYPIRPKLQSCICGSLLIIEIILGRWP